MKFINFNTFDEKGSLTSQEMGLLLWFEDHCPRHEEVYVCMIHPRMQETKANKIIAITSTDYINENGKKIKYESRIISGEMGHGKIEGLVGAYTNLVDALEDAKFLYQSPSNAILESKISMLFKGNQTLLAENKNLYESKKASTKKQSKKDRSL